MGAGAHACPARARADGSATGRCRAQARGRRAPRGEDRMPRARAARGGRGGRRRRVEPALDAGLRLRGARRARASRCTRGTARRRTSSPPTCSRSPSTGAELVIDDGAELTRRMAEHRPDLFAQLAGRERGDDDRRRAAPRARGRRPAPVPRGRRERRASCKHLFDNPYGTGQTTLTAILALTNVLAAGREFCIVGYG